MTLPAWLMLLLLVIALIGFGNIMIGIGCLLAFCMSDDAKNAAKKEPSE